MGKHGGGIVAAGLVLVVAGCTSPATASPPSSAPLSPTRPAPFTCVDDGVRAAGPCSRADYDAQQAEQATFSEAQQVYARFLSERNRLAHEGGADRPSDVMKQTAVDPYLSTVAGFLNSQRLAHRRVEGDIIARSFAIARDTRTEAGRFAMYVCEDARGTKAWSATGEDLGNGKLADSVFQFEPRDGNLKIVQADNEVVTACQH